MCGRLKWLEQGILKVSDVKQATLESNRHASVIETKRDSCNYE